MIVFHGEFHFTFQAGLLQQRFRDADAPGVADFHDTRFHCVTSG